MRGLLLVSILVTLTGCYPLTIEQLEAAKQYCKDRGYEARVEGYHSRPQDSTITPLRVYCTANSVEFLVNRERLK